MVLEENVVDPSVLAHRIEVELRESRKPLAVELLHARLPRRRSLHSEEAKQTPAIGDVSFDQAAQLALRDIPVGEVWFKAMPGCVARAERVLQWCCPHKRAKAEPE